MDVGGKRFNKSSDANNGEMQGSASTSSYHQMNQVQCGCEQADARKESCTWDGKYTAVHCFNRFMGAIGSIMNTVLEVDGRGLMFSVG